MSSPGPDATNTHPATPGRPPIASVVIAAHDEERHIGACLRSLAAQTFTSLEVIVVDDGSRDGTSGIVAGTPGVRLLRQPHGGKARAVNRGARHASGEVLLFLDADMWFDRRYVELMVNPILAGACTGTSHGTEVIANPGNFWSAGLQARDELPPDRRFVLTPELRARGSVIFRAVRRSAFLAVGGFDDLGYFDDHTLAPKLGARARIVEEAVCYHQNPCSAVEIVALGRWFGRSLVRQRGGLRSLLQHLPPRVVYRAARRAVRLRRPAQFIFDMTFDAGVTWAVLGYVTGLNRSFAR